MCAVSVVCTAREVRRARRRRRAWPVRLGVCASTVRAGRCGGCWGTVVRLRVCPWLSEEVKSVAILRARACGRVVRVWCV